MKQMIWKIVGTLVILAIVVAGVFCIGYFAMGIQDAESLQGLLNNLGGWSYVIFILLYIAQSLFLNVIPGTTTAFITAGFLMFGNTGKGFWIAFAVCMIAVYLSSIALYFLGRYGGRKLLFWLFGRKALESKLDWFARNGQKAVPWLFLVPLMTTDLLCIVCGASKMKFWHYMLIVIVFRPVEMLIIYSYKFIYAALASLEPYMILLIVNVLIIDIVLLIIYHRAILKLFKKTFAPKKYAKECAEEQERKGFLRAFRWRKCQDTTGSQNLSQQAIVANQQKQQVEKPKPQPAPPNLQNDNDKKMS